MYDTDQDQDANQERGDLALQLHEYIRAAINSENADGGVV
jgi:hypothetical protein